MALLPKITIQRCVQEALSDDGKITMSPAALELANRCCVEFLRLVASEAAECSEKAGNKIILQRHVNAALTTLQFPTCQDPPAQPAKKGKGKKIQASKERAAPTKKKRKKHHEAATPEEAAEMAAQQDALLNASKERMGL
ncbi:unnamed protein product [Chrysoparadoxa australica]